jgi:hypothetical protein
VQQCRKFKSTPTTLKAVGNMELSKWYGICSKYYLIHSRISQHPQEIYRDGLLNNRLLTVTTDPNKLEEQARTHLGARSFNYVAGGAGEKATMDANRLAFRQWKVSSLTHLPQSVESQSPDELIT